MLFGFSFVIVVLVVVFANMMINFVWFPRLVPKRVPEGDNISWPLVSILIPARNEESNIKHCVESLLQQNYPHFEVLVLDDQSTDRTGEILKTIQSKNPRGPLLKILEGKPLADGWIGKCWACHQLSEHAKGEWLLFTDADTQHDPGTLTSAFLLAEEQRADLVSLWPHQKTKTFFEQLVVPMVQLILIGYCPLWLINIVQSPKMIAACGQFMLWNTKAYRKVGGHISVKSHLVEDVALAGQAMKHRLRLINGDGTEVISTRMYSNFKELWNGFTKNFYTGFGGHPLPFFIFLTLQVVPFLLPWIWFGFFAADLMGGVPGKIPFSPFMELPVMTGIFGLLGTLLFCFIIHALPAIRFRQTGLSAIAYPISEILLLAIGINSFLQSRSQKGVVWKGRRIVPTSLDSDNTAI